MNTMCEHHEQNLSAILDGELANLDLPATLDHLVDCPTCAAFYRRSRDLEAAIDAIENPEGVVEAPPRVWERIESAISWRPHVDRETRWIDWAPRLAAVVLLAFGLWMFRAVDPGAPEITPSVASVEEEAPVEDMELQVGELDMTETRFVEITAEVLRADQRYHQKMLEVMETVTRPEYREASGESTGRPEGGDESERISLGEADNSVDVASWRF